MLYCFPLLFIPFIWWLYQIRCTDSEVCTKSGVKVVVTDSIDDNRTDFYLFSPTFQSLARTNKTDQLLDMGAGLDVEYKRWAPNLKQITIISLTEFEATKCEYLYIYVFMAWMLSHYPIRVWIFIYLFMAWILSQYPMRVFREKYVYQSRQKQSLSEQSCCRVFVSRRTNRHFCRGCCPGE